ncbi:MAG: HAMP domain-containing histidine kinase [Deltaproteobacteria bacterium]|nr:HAMP domain-containing histidine kinase [Deltaproteobacteria bacterium]
MNRRTLSLTGAIVAITVGVLVPVLLSTTVGIVAIAIGESSADLVLGILVICLAAGAIGGGVAATVLLGRRARIARLQSDLLANVTHELRTPLAGIRLHAQTLQSDIDPEHREECVNSIVRETVWLEAMIDRVLTWRTASKDWALLDLTREPVGDVLAAAASRFRKMIDPDEVDFAVDLETSAAVEHDHRALMSIILNLLVNAYKYTGDEKKIRLAARDESDEVVITVEDNGPGIPRRQHKRIFEPFHRADNSRSGAGLGLAIVHHQVEAHKGSITVDSVKGEGSTFSIRLPVAEDL